ncbi:hypothetical protein ABQE58_24595 [Mycolicibacterium elephantis]|uniref:hypothetical protein n=1 Tax=Mycolicibacterium elephantis TaxID=81858 RepID=UPI000AEB7DEB|nr:hypothetical protein [Mycolicibacterium elephantis]
MGEYIGAPISAALELKPTVGLPDIEAALAAWLKDSHGVELKPGEHHDLVVEWRVSNGKSYACQLVTAQSSHQERSTVTALRDEAGAVVFIEKTPFAGSDSPHATVDLSEDMKGLFRSLGPLAQDVVGHERHEIHNLSADDPEKLLTSLQSGLAPGLLIAIVENESAKPSTSQRVILDALRGLALAGWAHANAALINNLKSEGTVRPGSLISIARTSFGLDAHIVASTSLKTKPASARRLILRRQLSAPIPFEVERRRSSAMTRLLSRGEEIDLPTALQLLDEENQRANALENRVKDLETQLQRALDEQDTALGDLDDALSRLRYLDRAFRELGQIPTVEADFDDDWRPESSVDALMAAQELLPFLTIGPTEAHCKALDSQQKRSIWAKKIWLSLRALNDYCRAKTEGRFSGDVAMYRDNPPDGSIPLLAEYAAFESESTSNQPSLRALRMFPVPASVDTSGMAYMQQHVKVDRGGQSAPRIHFYDDSGGATQRIYVGYIGPHLATSTTF